MPWTTYPSSMRGFNTLTFMDLARNALTGTLPPELANISTTSLMLSVFDNNGLHGCPARCLLARSLTRCPLCARSNGDHSELVLCELFFEAELAGGVVQPELVWRVAQRPSTGGLCKRHLVWRGQLLHQL